MTMNTRYLIVALGLALLGSANAAGFNCKYAKTQVETMICGNVELSRLDEEMNTLFKQIESETAGVDADTGRMSDPAGREQMQWLRQVRNRCETEACLVKAYKQRLKDMRRNWAGAL